MPEQCPSCGEWALYEEGEDEEYGLCAECANCGVLIPIA